MVEKKIRPKFSLFDQAASFGLRNLIKSQADVFQNYIKSKHYSRWSKWLMIWLWCPHLNLKTTTDRGVLEEAGCFSNKDLVSHFCLFYKSECWCSSNYFREWMTLLKDERHEQDLESSKLFEIKCFFISIQKIKMVILYLTIIKC